MKILLDECVTKHLKSHLIDHQVFTVREMNWSGIKNGKLIALCVENGFDLFLTIDKNLHYQQNLNRYPLAIIILNSSSSKIEELVPFVPKFLALLPSIEKMKAYILEK
jgi:hypothetical protein